MAEYVERRGQAAKSLAAQLAAVDMGALSRMFGEATSRVKKQAEVAVLPHTALSGLTEGERAGLEREGLECAARGGAAVVTMAGGQGTRLGFDGPKGCFDFGAGKSLFEIQAEELAALGASSGGAVPWYVMTSAKNRGETEAHFEARAFFGLPRGDVFFFQQGDLPMLSPGGELLLESEGALLSGPDGNGGVFSALKASGALADMAARGVEWVFFCGIDNALVKPADPVFLGFTMGSGLPCGSKSVAKLSPEERVGVFCTLDGRPGIIEYTELSEELRYKTGPGGGLLFADANIIAHFFKRDLLEEICGKGLPVHGAVKKSHVYENGEVRERDVLKLETFIFDAFAFCSGMALLRTEREREFAPVKNAKGEDSPATALALYLKNRA